MLIIPTDIQDGVINSDGRKKVLDYAAKFAYAKIEMVIYETENSNLFFQPVSTEKLKTDYECYYNLVHNNETLTDPNAIVEKAYEIESWCAYGSQMQASMRVYLNAKKRFAVQTMPDDVKNIKSAKVQADYVDGECGEYEGFYEAIVRLNAAAQNKIKLMITHISLEKALMTNK